MLSKLALLFFLSVLISCEPFRPVESEEAEATATVENDVFQFSTTLKVDPGCLDDSQYAACLFLKNPVAQEKVLLSSSSPPPEELQKFQTLAIVSSPGSLPTELKNDSFDILNHGGARAKPSGNSWKFRVGEGDSNAFGQVMAFFWLNYAAVNAEQQAGAFWAKAKGIKVILNDTFTGWSPHGNSIHLAKPKDGRHLTYSAGIMIYYLGLANLHHATGGSFHSFNAGEEKHKNCGASSDRPKHCCVDADGCSMAIASGSADYFVAASFPSSPTLGEAWVNRLEGLQACDLSRDLEANKNLSVSSAFAACSSQGSTGYIYNMGSVYASIWWEVRKKAESRNIDRLYQLHLRELSAEDDFISAFNKIIQTDRSEFNGQHTELFRTEFHRRGIAVP